MDKFLQNHQKFQKSVRKIIEFLRKFGKNNAKTDKFAKFA